MAYDVAVATAFRGIGEGPEIPERLLWKLWKRRAAQQEAFRTSEGTRIRVLYPGRSGAAAGPDFRDALLDIEGLGLVRGDVEIHRRQRDWAGHGHGDDPNYNGVIVHGALEVDGSETVLASGTSSLVVSLEDLLDGDSASGELDLGEPSVTSGLWDWLAARGYSRPDGVTQAGELLDRAGDERFRRKAALLGRFAAEQRPEQALYEALMEGLGYRHNQQPFVKLAQAAPVAALRQAALPVLAEQRPMVLRHWLLVLSGLSDSGNKSERRLPAGVGPAMERKEWRLFRVRPANHPAVRIEGAADLLARFLESGLIAGLAGLAQSPSQLTAALTVEGRDGGTAPVGTGRARDLAVNVALPMLHSLGGNSESTFLELYRSFPKLQGNEVAREMSEQLLDGESRKAVNSARRQQGLLHLAGLLRGGRQDVTELATGPGVRAHT